jgi:hypothetical protein
MRYGAESKKVKSFSARLLERIILTPKGVKIIRNLSLFFKLVNTGKCLLSGGTN